MKKIFMGILFLISASAYAQRYNVYTECIKEVRSYSPYPSFAETAKIWTIDG